MRRELLLLLDLVAVGGDLVRRRVDRDLAALAIDDDVVAVGDLVDAVFLVQADDRRDRACLGDDDGMRRRRARAQEHARDLLRRHTRDNGRLDLAAAEDDFLVTDLRLLDAEDELRDALADIAEVDGARGEILVVHLLEHLRLLLRGAQHAARRVAELVDLLLDVVRHHRILHHHAVRLEDSRLLLRLLILLHLLDALTQLLGHRRERRLGLPLLRLLVLGLIAHEIAVEVLSREHDLAHGDTGDNALATNFFCHNSFPQILYVYGDPPVQPAAPRVPM